MKTLLIDFGNTYFKYQLLFSDNSTSTITVLRTNSFSAELTAFFEASEGQAIEKIIIAAVAKKSYQDALKELLSIFFSESSTYWLQATARLGHLKNGYEHPEALGIDRWLGLFALSQKKLMPAWLISVGTAITVDYLDENAAHCGGWILPGLQAFEAGLLKTTALQVELFEPMVPMSSPWPLATNTKNSVSLGVYGTLFAFFQKITLIHPGKLIFSGGGGKWFAEKLESQYIPYLVLNGLQAWQKHHQ